MCISVLVYDWRLLVYLVVVYCVCACLFVPVIVVVVAVVSMVCVWFGFGLWFGVVKAGICCMVCLDVVCAWLFCLLFSCCV